MKTWWGIRHLRYFFLVWEFNDWWSEWGHLMGAVPNQSDLEYLKDVWEGRA